MDVAGLLAGQILILVYIFMHALSVGGPGTARHHNRLRQAGLASMAATVLHPRTQPGDSAETGRALFRLQLL